jgi:hypothetical protein
MPKGIFYDETTKTFRLYCGDSLYVFCIGPELNIEHLYWGASLHDECDLRYLFMSARAAQFTTTEYSGFQPNPHFDVPAGVEINPDRPVRMNRSMSLAQHPMHYLHEHEQGGDSAGGTAPGSPGAAGAYVPAFTLRDLLHLQKRSLHRQMCSKLGPSSEAVGSSSGPPPLSVEACPLCRGRARHSYCGMQHHRLENLSEFPIKRACL